jgi:hypothetical protein
METNKNETTSQATNVSQLWVNVKKARKSKDGQYVIIELEDGRLMRKHVNFFKAILGISFTPKAKPAAA